MAFCPICRTPIPWWKVLFLDRWNFIICKTCGTDLRTNKKRTLTILVFFSIPFIITAYIRDMELLSRKDMIPLIVFWGVLLLFSWFFFTKLEACHIISDSQERYRSAAESGNVNAQFSLGWMYATGQGVQQNYQQALYWYLKAAEQGDADAQNNLGVMLRLGQGIQQDIQQAAQWYRKAAEQGHADAENTLGVMYADGLGVKQDIQQAAQWYRKAAEQGFALAQYNLGWAYANGRGVQQDDQQAIHWIRKSAEQGFEQAIKELKTLKHPPRF